jgi:hypothetical protein
LPGALPGVLGLAAFAGIKFAGYSIAVVGLKQKEPTIHSRAVTIAATRTALGLVLGPLASLFLLFLIGLAFDRSGTVSSSSYSSLEMPTLYALLFGVRILVWALVLFLFTAKSPLSRGKFWAYTVTGAVVSCLLDWPGYALAIATPGKISVC